MIKTIGIIALVLFTTMSSCKKDSNNDEYLSANATIIWQGAYEVDGCGFFVKIDNHEYKPENEEIFNESFQTSENQTALIEYVLLNKKVEYWCGDGMNANEIDGIRIISVN